MDGRLSQPLLEFIKGVDVMCVFEQFDQVAPDESRGHNVKQAATGFRKGLPEVSGHST